MKWQKTNKESMRIEREKESERVREKGRKGLLLLIEKHGKVTAMTAASNTQKKQN